MDRDDRTRLCARSSCGYRYGGLVVTTHPSSNFRQALKAFWITYTGELNDKPRRNRACDSSSRLGSAGRRRQPISYRRIRRLSSGRAAADRKQLFSRGVAELSRRCREGVGNKARWRRRARGNKNTPSREKWRLSSPKPQLARVTRKVTDGPPDET